MRLLRSLVLGPLLALSSAGSASAESAVVEVSVTGPRVRLGDVVRGGSDDVDLGAVPPPGGSRVLERVEIERSARAQGKPPPQKIPAAVRVVRKMRQLSRSDIESLARAAVVQALPAGATLEKVRVVSSLSVPDGYDRVTAELPKPAKRTGQIPLPAMLVFSQKSEEIFRAPIVVDVSLSAQARAPDVTHGSAIEILVRRGLVEIRSPGVATADADVGAVIPVTLRPSGKVVRARVLDREHGLVVEGP